MLKEEQLLNTLVFETLGNPEKEREFKVKALKKWGLELVFGKKNGEEELFITKDKKVGEKFQEDENEYEVIEILKELPKNQKLFAHIDMIEGRAYITIELETTKRQELISLPAGELLLAFLKKHNFTHIKTALRNLGSAATLIKHHGEEGVPVPFELLPPVPRRFLREAKKIEKEMGFGRIALAYFGENKDLKARFWLEWMVPTIALFDEHIAQKIDKTLAEMK